MIASSTVDEKYERPPSRVAARSIPSVDAECLEAEKYFLSAAPLFDVKLLRAEKIFLGFE